MLESKKFFFYFCEILSKIDNGCKFLSFYLEKNDKIQRNNSLKNDKIQRNTQIMVLKCFFDRVVALIGLLFLWPVLLVVAILVKVKMPGGPAFFVQKRVGKGGKLFNCHKFRSMLVAPARNENEDENENKSGWSTVSVAGDSRITPFGAKLRHYKIDELPGLWDVLIGNMSFVGPRPDVPGYVDKLEGDDRDVLKLRPGITGPATLKYRLEDEMIAVFIDVFMNANYRELNVNYPQIKMTEEVMMN